MTGPIPVLTEIRLSSIIESSDDAILTKDAEGTITSWNPAAERMYGWTADEAIGQKISIPIPEDRSGEEWRILEQVLGGEQVDHYESDRVHRSGRRIRVSLSISPLNRRDRRDRRRVDHRQGHHLAAPLEGLRDQASQAHRRVRK